MFTNIKLSGWMNLMFEIALGYETQKVVQIHSKSIGLINRFVQFSILIYICLWVMWWERGYQAADTIISGTSVKVSGGPLYHIKENGNKRNEFMGQKIWDIADVVVPPQQNSGFFITTKVIVTPNQTQSFCAESSDVRLSLCRHDSDCPSGYLDNTMHGPFTGHCLKNVGRCEIFGWCPVEEVNEATVTNEQVFKEVLEYTVLISNTVKFRKLSIKRQNVMKHLKEEDLEKCRYHPTVNPLCPVFRVGDIFRWASGGPINVTSSSDYDSLLLHGGIIAISIDWTCDFDLAEELCLPKYSFTKLQNERETANDQDEEAQEAGLASGWSIHHTNQYEKGGVKHRILTKAIGVQFFIHTTGKGWKFDLANFTMNCGSGLALFGGATFFCDMILLYFLKKRKIYRLAKCDVLKNEP